MVTNPRASYFISQVKGHGGNTATTLRSIIGVARGI
jgi:hypothetical protein